MGQYLFLTHTHTSKWVHIIPTPMLKLLQKTYVILPSWNVAVSPSCTLGPIRTCTGILGLQVHFCPVNCATFISLCETYTKGRNITKFSLLSTHRESELSNVIPQKVHVEPQVGPILTVGVLPDLHRNKRSLKKEEQRNTGKDEKPGIMIS